MSLTRFCGTVLALALFTSSLQAQQVVTLPRETKDLRDPLTEVFSVGREEGQSWELLANVTGVAFDRQDNLYILDTGNFRVLVFDRTGKFVRQIGKQGQGPGEFGVPVGIAILQNGDLVVGELLRGYSIFGPDGTFKRVVNADQQGGLSPGSGSIQASSRGGIVARTGGVMLMMRAGGETPTPPKAFIRHLPLTDATQSTVLHEMEMPMPMISQRVTRGGTGGGAVIRGGGGGGGQTRVMGGQTMFLPTLSWGVLPNGGVAIIDSANYDIRLTDAAGKVVRRITRSDAPRKVTKADQDAAREQRRRVMSGQAPGGTRIMVSATNGGTPQVTMGGPGGATLPPEQIEQQLKEMTFAEVMPVVQGITTDPTGRIWVERTPAKFGDQGPIELITATGTYIGRVTGKRRPISINGNGTLAAWVERDDLDVEKVVVRRLPASWKPVACAPPECR